ncbi:uncharacterized protein [Dermacentor andersoni]|uniref:uncharacterized protein n=1 Tax=Dermacentor andersoni TaxID=34620 RepID=UPI002417B828|nr:uncharacterized protein LOC126540271 [Dermacentor andersoni]
MDSASDPSSWHTPQQHPLSPTQTGRSPPVNEPPRAPPSTPPSTRSKKHRAKRRHQRMQRISSAIKSPSGTDVASPKQTEEQGESKPVSTEERVASSAVESQQAAGTEAPPQVPVNAQLQNADDESSYVNVTPPFKPVAVVPGWQTPLKQARRLLHGALRSREKEVAESALQRRDSKHPGDPGTEVMTTGRRKSSVRWPRSVTSRGYHRRGRYRTYKKVLRLLEVIFDGVRMTPKRWDNF